MKRSDADRLGSDLWAAAIQHRVHRPGRARADSVQGGGVGGGSCTHGQDAQSECAAHRVVESLGERGEGHCVVLPVLGRAEFVGSVI